LLTTAFRFASASTLAPFSYPQIIFMSLLSWLVFSQPPGLSFYAGVPLVVASGLYIWMRERRLANKRPVVPTG
jgi:drug/metabolite transporter (DMT)-like permease